MAYVCKGTLLVNGDSVRVRLYSCHDKSIMTGVESNTNRITVDQLGTVADVGHVYYSVRTNANKLSFATQVDNGAQILYDNVKDVFTIRSKHSKRTNFFSFIATSSVETAYYTLS